MEEPSEDQIKEALEIVKVKINDFVEESKQLTQGQRLDKETEEVIDHIDALKPFACKQFLDDMQGPQENLLVKLLCSGNE